MKAHLTYIRTVLALTMRDWQVLFFNYIFPLFFFFMFGQLRSAGQGAVALEVVNMVLVIGVIGSGLFGAGIRSTAEREQNILRRFKVAPITPSPILWSSYITGLIHYLPILFGIMFLAATVYKMPWPERWFSVTIFVAAGVLAFRGIGAIIAAVVNSMAESQIITQLLYFPMLFLSGATFPLTFLPDWVQTVSQFLPSTHLYSGLQRMLIQKKDLSENLTEFGALLLTTAVTFFIAFKLFRWEKEEKLSASAKLWVLAALAPFVLMGAWQMQTKENIRNAKIIDRELRRAQPRLIRNVRIYLGGGQVIESGGVLIRDGKIAEIYNGAAPDAKSVQAGEVEGAGKTLLPGLIDTHVHLSAPGAVMDYSDPKVREELRQIDIGRSMRRAAAAYLFSGVTAFRSAGDGLDTLEMTARDLERGTRNGAELFFAGPMFTAEGGHGTEYFRHIPEPYKQQAMEQTVRTPKTPAEAREQVLALKARGVTSIKAILESGSGSMPFKRLDPAIYRAIADAAREAKLPLSTHTSTVADVAEAVDAGTSSVEHGAMSGELPDALISKMKEKGIAYTPTLSVMDSMKAIADLKTEPFERTLVLQVGPAPMLVSSKALILSPKFGPMAMGLGQMAKYLDTARRNLTRAHQAGVIIVAGTDSGNPGLIHGPAIHREMQLLVDAGLTPAAAIEAATGNAARLLGIGNRTGAIRKGLEATMVLVDGNPLQDITATERISSVFLKGERIGRGDLFDEDKKDEKKSK